eukprot:13081207-Alexandrium_andersonii.AAC.1
MAPPAFEVRQWVRRQLMSRVSEDCVHVPCERAIDPARAILLLVGISGHVPLEQELSAWLLEVVRARAR